MFSDTTYKFPLDHIVITALFLIAYGKRACWKPFPDAPPTDAPLEAIKQEALDAYEAWADMVHQRFRGEQ